MSYKITVKANNQSFDYELSDNPTYQEFDLILVELLEKDQVDGKFGGMPIKDSYAVEINRELADKIIHILYFHPSWKYPVPGEKNEIGCMGPFRFFLKLGVSES